MRVKYSRRALLDLGRIYRYIAEDNPPAAMRMLLALYAACDGLGNFPRRGRLGGKAGSRELTTVPPYLILFEIWSDGTVVIDSIWHGAQDRGR